jgi:predicted lipoprotein
MTMFKQILCCLLLLPLTLLAETTTVAPASPLPDADKLLVQVVDGAIIPLYRDNSDADQLAAFQGDTGKRRCAYVQAASELLQTTLHSIAEAWVNDKNGYATAFRTADKGNTTFASSRQAVDLLVGKLFQSAEKLSKNRIGNALGKGIDLNTEGKQEVLNTSNAYQLEAWRSGYAIQVIRANQSTRRATWFQR